VIITSNGGTDFRQLAAKFKAAGQHGAAVRKATTKAIQSHLSRITDEQKAEIMAWKPGGVSGRGETRRQRYSEAQAASRFARSGRTRRPRASHSLRSYIRGAIKSRVAYTGRRIGAKIFVDPSALPPSQRNLPKHVDNPRGWRHPVWGHRDRWSHQSGTPYFSGPIERHYTRIAADVQAEVDKAMRTLQ
jgi:hypothetical protein